MHELLLFGEIGWENTSKDVVAQLGVLGGEDVTVRINSPGGDVYEGLAIMNALRGHQGAVTVIIEGLAASAASFIAVGGADRIVCRPNAEIMIHEAWTFVDGNADALQKTLTDLERISGNLAGIYAERTGGDPDHWRELMRAETWFSAEEALQAGLVDAVEDARQPAAASAGRSPVSAKMLARFKFNGRGAAPPPPINNEPSDGQEGGAMGFLNKLAQELGKDPEAVKNALSQIMNESVEVPGTVTVVYPDSVQVVPTGKSTIAPTEPLPEGVEVSAAAVSDNFSAEIAEDGTITVRATDAVSVGDVGEVTVTVTAGGEPVEVVVKAEVVAADAEEDQETDPAPPETPETPGVPVPPSNDQITMDADTYAELRAAAQFGWKAMEAEKAANLEKEVDGWIKEGRISAGLRAKAIKAIQKDAEVARDLYGSNPVNTIPRSEVGYGLDVDLDKSEVPTADELRALSKSRRAGEKK